MCVFLTPPPNKGGRLRVWLSCGLAQQHRQQIKHSHLICSLGNSYPSQWADGSFWRVWHVPGAEPQKRQEAQQEYGSTGLTGDQECQHRWERERRTRKCRNCICNSYSVSYTIYSSAYKTRCFVGFFPILCTIASVSRYNHLSYANLC